MTERTNSQRTVECRKCGKDCSNHHWVCGWQPGEFCEECFLQNPCGQGMHGEHCHTQVLQGGEL